MNQLEIHRQNLLTTATRKANQIPQINNACGVVAIKSDHSNRIEFSPETTADQVKAWAHKCAEYCEILGQMRLVSKLWIGNATLEYAARREITTQEALDELEFPNLLGLTTKTILSYVKTVERMGDDAYIEGLSESQIFAVAGFRGPASPEKAMDFADRRRNFLHEIAGDNGIEDAQKWTTRRISVRMRELQAEFDLLPAGKRLVDDVVSNYARLSYMYRHCTDDWYETQGITKAEVSGWLENYELQMAEKEILPYMIEELDIPHYLKPASLDVDEDGEVDISNI